MIRTFLTSALATGGHVAHAARMNMEINGENILFIGLLPSLPGPNALHLPLWMGQALISEVMYYLNWDYPTCPQMTSKFVEIVLLIHRHGNSVPFATLRCGNFGRLIKFGTPYGKAFLQLDAPLPSFSPLRRFPRPTPERVLVADRQSGSGCR